MKKLLLALFVILASIDVSGAINDIFVIDQLVYTVTSEENHEVQVSVVNYPTYVDFEIPAEVTNNSTSYSVTSISDYGFAGHTDIINVVIPASVKEIGDWAFYTCTGLASVTIPESVRYIGEYSFYQCTGLTSVILAESITKIGKSAFKGCIGLTSLAIPDSVTEIGKSAFEGCAGLTSLAIPGSVKYIGDDAFWGCIAMAEISVSVDNLKYSSIEGVLYNKNATALIVCPAGRSGGITLPESVVEIQDNAFCYCEGLTSLAAPSSLTSIGASAFGGCTGLTSFVIPSNVKYIGDYAFESCNSLASIHIPASVTEIGHNVFYDCTALVEILVDGGNSVLSSVDGVMLDKDRTKVICCPMGKTGDFVIPGSVIYIGNQAFLDCSRLSSVVMPNSVKEIGWQAFDGCSGLNCVSIPESVTSLGSNAFANCAALTSIRISASLNEMVDNPFVGCRSLAGILVDDNNVDFCSVDGVLFNKEKSKLRAFPGGRGGEYIIPESVKEIGKNAFLCCTGLSSVHIPASVNIIGWSAFNRCTSLADVYCAGEKPARVSPTSFDCFTYNEGILYVPEGALEEYNKFPWSRFCDIRTYSPSGIDDAKADIVPEQPVEIYNINGMYVGSDLQSLMPGLYIVRQGGTTKKIVVN